MSTVGVKCGECSKVVYPIEPQLNLDGRKFHSKCARCKEPGCGKQLTVTDFGKASDFIDGDMSVFCKRHYEAKFLVSDLGYKGKWAKSQIAENSIQIQKRKNDDVLPEVIAPVNNPTKRMSVSNIDKDNEEEEEEEDVNLCDAANTEELVDVCEADQEPEALDVSIIGAESSFIAADNSTANVSAAGSSLSNAFNSHIATEQSQFLDEEDDDEDERNLSGCSNSPLNDTMRTRGSTEKTEFMGPTKMVDVTGETSLSGDISVIEATPNQDEQGNMTTTPLATPIKVREEIVNNEEDSPAELNPIQLRIRELNRSTSKHVPTPTSLKKADPIAVQYFGSHRLTFNKTANSADNCENFQL